MRGIPKEAPAGDDWCEGLKGKGWSEPLASVTLPDGSLLAASVVCFASTRTVYNPAVSARSLVAWRSTDGGLHYHFAGMIVDAADVVPHDSSAGPTPDVDLALMADNTTVMAAIKMDGWDCTCTGSVGTDGCGQYRPFYVAYSDTLGTNWSHPRPLPGTGCVRPRLLSLGPDAPMLLSGGRLCHATGPKELFLW